MNLSKSEKIVLVVFLVVLVLGLGGWLLVYPAIQNIPNSQADLDKAKTEREIVYQNLAREDTIDEEIKQALDQGKEMQKYFYDDLQHYEADMILRDILEKTNMSTDGLNIDAFTTQQLTLIDFVDIAVSYPLKEYANIDDVLVFDSTGEESSEEGVSASDALTPEEFEAQLNAQGTELKQAIKDYYFSYLSQFTETVGATTINFTVKGTRGDYLKFLDYVKDLEKATYISDASIMYTGDSITTDENGNTVTGSQITYRDNSKVEASITITFYSVKPISEDVETAA